jgi:hypothetical protein
MQDLFVIVTLEKSLLTLFKIISVLEILRQLHHHMSFKFNKLYSYNFNIYDKMF